MMFTILRLKKRRIRDILISTNRCLPIKIAEVNSMNIMP